ncbi:hypothetical protein BJG93_04435 [Paraburkholderia sprentiae WSM5005]|uniref:Uncharacterized protein n=1 Tax=Paraburkholderia sprentiae WSM5005 TaxID=754502 RepID=A0A1I9YEI5_9BURK|nr:hypothetical protein [Paraburkholderia sprentiae]APA84718.1 hypothetical protein BJG93_04435 [Paraburkholderia sprentiae WSM5005]
MDKLEGFHYFHDWNIDALAVRDRHKLVVMLEYDGKRATATFSGTTRCTVEHFSVSNNIVFEIKILRPGDANYDLALAMLSKSERFSRTAGRQVAIVLATAGAELAVEFETLEIDAE